VPEGDVIMMGETLCSGRLPECLQMAFKKLKSSAYFDKTQPVLREKIMLFEGSGAGSSSSKGFKARLVELSEALLSPDKEHWQRVSEEILKSVGVLVYPKSVKDRAVNASAEGAEGEERLISNRSGFKPYADKLQLFIDMDVEGYILGMLWAMTLGVRLDKSFADCSYGNRIRSDIGVDGALTWSPYLFQPYFQQYSRWRDGALDKAEQARADGADVLLLTLDFKSFYYSVDMRERDWGTVLWDAEVGSVSDAELGPLKRLNDFARAVVERYSALLREGDGDGANVLPLGFPPSPILANWCLSKFDAQVSNRLNPLFYGRYVDDVIIAEKVEDGSVLHEEWKDGQLTPQSVINHLLIERREILRKEDDDGSGKSNPVGYIVCDDCHKAGHSTIRIQESRFKVFYFEKSSPFALIEQFRETLSKNSSEFMLMPNIRSMSLKDSYSVLYDLKSGDFLAQLKPYLFWLPGVKIVYFKHI